MRLTSVSRLTLRDSTLSSPWPVSLVSLAVLLLLPSSAHADMGLPMIMIAAPVMALALPAIIAIEWFILWTWLGGSAGYAALTVSAVNVISTLIGIPVTWFILLVGQLITGGGSAYGIDTRGGKILAVTWQAPWLIPHEREFRWMIPAAGLVLLIPFFFASWFVEYRLLVPMLRWFKPEDLSTAALIGNLVTYGLLALVVSADLIAGIREMGRRRLPFAAWEREVFRKLAAEEAPATRGEGLTSVPRRVWSALPSRRHLHILVAAWKARAH